MEGFIKTHPETRILPGALYLIGESYTREDRPRDAKGYFERVVLCWTESDASNPAGVRLAELRGDSSVFKQARQMFESGQYIHAHSLFRALTFSPDREISGRANLAPAYCCCNMNRGEEASNLFWNWLDTHCDSPESPEA